MLRTKEIIETFSINLDGLIDDAQSLLGDVVDSRKKPLLELNIDATHSGRLTNDRVYPGIYMSSSVSSFLKPSPKPVLKNHMSSEDAIGRISGAKFVQLKSGKAFTEDFKRPSEGVGSGLIQLDINIMDPDAVDKFLDGRFTEFSTRQSFDSLLCSFCGNDFTKEYCGHYPGDIVKVEPKKAGGKVKEFNVYGITGKLQYKEVSVCNVPADAFTKINEMQAGQDSLNENFIISVYDDSNHDISKLVLKANAETDSVDLLRSGSRQAVTAEDRKKLTNKSIFCVAGPDFKHTIENINMAKEKIDPEKEEVLDNEETQNTGIVKDQLDDASKSSQETEETKASQEGVVAPGDKETDSSDEAKLEVSDEEVQNASLKALALTNKGLERDNESSRSEIERLKGEISNKDEEIERLRSNASDAQNKLKLATARQLLDNRMVLCKPDMVDVKDTKSYQSKLDELAKRSLDSLEDALADLVPELSDIKSSRTITDIAREKSVESPILDGTPDVINPDSSKDTEKKTKPISREQIIDAATS